MIRQTDQTTVAIRAVGAYQLSTETCVLLMVEPPVSQGTYTFLSQQLLTTPTPQTDMAVEENGNLIRRLLASAGEFRFEYTATLAVTENEPIPDDAVQHLPMELPFEAFTYLRPSYYCPSDRLTRLAQDMFGGITTGGGRVNAVCSWVHENLEYRYGTSNTQTTALDTLIERIGVCRDFSHLTIALCRALGIPARYVSGYALGLKPCDFHGYTQVYVGGAWQNVDATFAGVRPALIPIAFGRDAADVAMMTMLGGEATLIEQSVEVSSINVVK